MRTLKFSFPALLIVCAACAAAIPDGVINPRKQPTKWMEEKDTTVEKCIQNCQTGEEVCISVSITHFFRL